MDEHKAFEKEFGRTDQQRLDSDGMARHSWAWKGWKARAALSQRQAQEQVPEGCTPADARVLREANHALAAENHALRDALQFYSDKRHFGISDESAWDTVSGEPQNFWCDEAGTATIEDGTVAAMALAGTPLRDDEPAAQEQAAPAVPVDVAKIIRGLLLVIDRSCLGDSLQISEARAFLAAHSDAPAVPVARTDDEREADEYTIDRMAHLLAEIAVIVKGPERARHRHGFADLPALVMELAASKALAAPAEASQGGGAVVKLDEIEQYRVQMAGICTAAIGYWKEADGIHPDYDTPALRDVARLYAKFDALYKSADRQALIDWAADRWHAEVANRPMVNVHRRSLDDTWRQVLRHLGVNDRLRLGPTHDELRSEIGSKEWEAMNGGKETGNAD